MDYNQNKLFKLFLFILKLEPTRIIVFLLLFMYLKSLNNVH